MRDWCAIQSSQTRHCTKIWPWSLWLWLPDRRDKMYEVYNEHLQTSAEMEGLPQSDCMGGLACHWLWLFSSLSGLQPKAPPWPEGNPPHKLKMTNTEKSMQSHSSESRCYLQQLWEPGQDLWWPHFQAFFSTVWFSLVGHVAQIQNSRKHRKDPVTRLENSRSVS